MIRRIHALIVKEMQALLRDRQGRIMLVMPVLLQLAVFPFAATLEVNNNTLAVLNQDSGAESAEIIQRLGRAGAFKEIVYLHNEAGLRDSIDRQQALLVLRFPADFSRSLVSGRPAPIQAILDGRRSNSAQIALGYARQILQDFEKDRNLVYARHALSEITVRHWFNPNLTYVYHIIPSLVAIITTISTLVVTSLSVAREREQGTFDQLLVSPLTPGMIMIGKTVPALLVATFQGTLILAAGVFLYRIPFQGSVPLLYGSMLFYILALAGFGLLISSISSTQQQAFLGVFSFMMPAVLLSGFPSPVENMPVWLQYIDWFNPLRHFIVIVKGVFLKDADLAALVPALWPLLVIAVLTLSAANWMFRRRLG
jgi:drug efflux transport system permease protein